MALSITHPPRRFARYFGWPQVLGSLLIAIALLAPTVQNAFAAKGNAGAAIGFVESAQNKDGGFGARKGSSSNPQASLWAAAALIAAGKNPTDEWLKGGRSLDEYLVDKKGSFTSLTHLGLLALVQAGSGNGKSHFGDPAGKLRAKLSASAASANPQGAAFALLGLVAVGDSASNEVARATAQALASSSLADGGWGPNGSSDSRTTAIVLQALASSGVVDRSNPAVAKGFDYLKATQVNDGAIAPSIRTDQSFSAGDVGATAFAIQAYKAYGVASPRTELGKTLKQGLTQYQQQTTGGLSSNGSLYDPTFKPSTTETAQAFPAFNGTTYPLAAVAAKTSGPPKEKKKQESKEKDTDRVSEGTQDQGVSDNSQTNTDAGAFQKATAGQKTAGAKGTTDKAGSTAKKTAKKESQASDSGDETVTGEVVGASSAPKLATAAGEDPSAVSEETRATLGFLGLLLLLGGGGGFVNARHPRESSVGRTQAALIAGQAGFQRARDRGSLAPAAAVALGVLLIAIPFATNMWSRAPQGEKMVEAFKPYMSAERVAAYQRGITTLNAGIVEAGTKAPSVLYPGLSDEAAASKFQKELPSFAGIYGDWDKTNKSLHSVVDPIAQNQQGFVAIAALPRFGLFPWFFVIPGVLLILLGGFALWRPGSWQQLRWAVVAVGIGLMLAPIAFQMWERAPKGADLVAAFKPIENRDAVVRVQNDFSQVVIAQGSLSGELTPALTSQGGLTSAQVQEQFPAVTALGTEWIGIMNDLTPVIGVMSDNVTRFAAVAALPSLKAFPWLFTISGLLALLIVAAASFEASRRASRAAAEAALAAQQQPPDTNGVTPINRASVAAHPQTDDLRSVR